MTERFGFDAAIREDRAPVSIAARGARSCRLTGPHHPRRARRSTGSPRRGTRSPRPRCRRCSSTRGRGPARRRSPAAASCTSWRSTSRTASRSPRSCGAATCSGGWSSSARSSSTSPRTSSPLTTPPSPCSPRRSCARATRCSSSASRPSPRSCPRSCAPIEVAASCSIAACAGFPWIPLDASWTRPEERLNAGRRSDLRRARRIAERIGPVHVEVLSPSPTDLGRLLREAFAVEAAGWKGRAGTALACDPVRQTFFRRYADAACRRGMLRIGFLRIGDIPVAMQLGVEWGGRFWLLKIGYDEAFSRCSPGSPPDGRDGAARRRPRAQRPTSCSGSRSRGRGCGRRESVPASPCAPIPPTARGATALASDLVTAGWRRRLARADARSGVMAMTTPRSDGGAPVGAGGRWGSARRAPTSRGRRSAMRSRPAAARRAEGSPWPSGSGTGASRRARWPTRTRAPSTG